MNTTSKPVYVVSTAELVILVPVLHRPHRVRPLLDSVAAATPEPHRVLFICSPDDHAEIAAVDQAGADRLNLDTPPGRGDYARKINAGHRATSEPILFLAADDLAFHPGWWSTARDLLDRWAVVGTNDLGNRRVMRGEHATHSLVTRDYIDRFGTIDQPGRVLHEGYWHNFVDDEFIGTARHRGQFTFSRRSVVEHLHPNWHKSERDDTYDRGQARFEVDRRLCNRRRHLWT